MNRRPEERCKGIVQVEENGFSYVRKENSNFRDVVDGENVEMVMKRTEMKMLKRIKWVTLRDRTGRDNIRKELMENRIRIRY